MTKIKVEVEFEDDFIKELTPTELPSDAEIECTGNNGNGCFMDSCGHNCGCVGIQPKL